MLSLEDNSMCECILNDHCYLILCRDMDKPPPHKHNVMLDDAHLIEKEECGGEPAVNAKNPITIGVDTHWSGSSSFFWYVYLTDETTESAKERPSDDDELSLCADNVLWEGSQ